MSAGRPLPDPGFPGDDGSADPRLAAALAALAHDPAAEGAVLAALAAARVLVPVVAVLGEEAAVAPGGLRREKSADMAVLTLVGADGRRALPVFSSVAALAQWRPDARPVPVEAARAALAALSEGAAVLVLDVATAGYVVEGRALRALAEGRAMLPAYDDPAVAAAVADAVVDEPAVRAAYLVPAAGADARLGLVLAPGTAPAQVRALAARVGARLRESEALRASVLRGFDVAVLPPGAEPRDRPPLLHR